MVDAVVGVLHFPKRNMSCPCWEPSSETARHARPHSMNIRRFESFIYPQVVLVHTYKYGSCVRSYWSTRVRIRALTPQQLRNLMPKATTVPFPILSKLESRKFPLIELVIRLCIDSSVKKYFSLLNQSISLIESVKNTLHC